MTYLLNNAVVDPGRSAAPVRTGPGAAGEPADRSGRAPADRAPGGLLPRRWRPEAGRSAPAPGDAESPDLRRSS